MKRMIRMFTFPMACTGSGTLDLNLGGTAVRFFDSYSIGAQASGLFRTGRNKHHYRLGNQYKVSAWAQRQLGNQVSTAKIKLNCKNRY